MHFPCVSSLLTPLRAIKAGWFELLDGVAADPFWTLPALVMADKYRSVLELGSGAFGTAWLMSEKSSGREVVTKVIKMKSLSKVELDRCITEVAILSACSHANIVRYIEAFVSQGCLHIVMEYAKEGDLHQRLRNQQGVPLQKEVVLDWFVQIILALDYIHSRNILHRDLKPQNVFIMEDNTLKLGDFGIAKILCGQGDFASTMIGTPYYISPEICHGKQYNSRSDMWAAGCLLYQMCHLQVPFDAPTLPELYQVILQGHYKPIPSHYDITITYLVSQLLCVSPDDRLQAKDILAIPNLSSLVTLHSQRQTSYKRSRSQSRSRSQAKPQPQGVKASDSEQTLQDEHRTESTTSENHTINATETDSRKTCPVKTLKPADNLKKISCHDNDQAKKNYAKPLNSLDQQLGVESNPHSLGNKSEIPEKIANSCVRDNIKQGGTHAPRRQQAVLGAGEAVGRESISRECQAAIRPRREMTGGRCFSDNSPAQAAPSKSRTYTVKEHVARRLSQASPTLSSTIAKQRFALSISDPAALKQVKPGDQQAVGAPVARDWEMDGEVIDDVFSPAPRLRDGASNIVDSRTYVVQRKDSVDPNNNAGPSCDQNVSATIVEALSVSGFNREMSRRILLNGLVCRVGEDRSQDLVEKVRRIVVENGQTYQTLQAMLNVDERELIPLIAMLCWILLNGLVCRVGEDRSRDLVEKVRRIVVENGQTYQMLQAMLNVDERELIPLIAMLCW